MRNFATELKISVIMTGALAAILCGVYPLAVFATAQGFFPDKANGSVVYRDAGIVGSRLVGQSFSGARYFHPRPSAAGAGYDAANSGGSNLGPTSQKLVDTVQERVEQYRQDNGLDGGVAVPADAVTASGSGLDPDISVANALLQTPRVAKARGMNEDEVMKMVRDSTRGRDLGVLGEPRVNVLALNLSLDTSEGRGHDHEGR